MPRIKDATGRAISKKTEQRCHRSSGAGENAASELVLVKNSTDDPGMNPSTIATPSNFSKRPAMDQGSEDEDAAVDGRHAEKKRRLSVEQVKSLERHFEEDNKLEPERKLHLAKELGLQPRQVAVWFQNRRARWKTKQLEKDYDALKENLDALRADYNTLAQEKQELEAEVNRLHSLLSAKHEEPKPQGRGVDTSETSDHTKESESDSGTTATLTPVAAIAARKDCSSSWDSDGSEIVDDDQITPCLDQSESGGFPLPGDEDRILMDTLGCPMPPDMDDAYADATNSMVYSTSSSHDRMISKLEEAGYESANAGGFFDLGDQSSLSWWDWS